VVGQVLKAFNLFHSNAHNNNVFLAAYISFAMYNNLKPYNLAGLEHAVFRSRGCCDGLYMLNTDLCTYEEFVHSNYLIPELLELKYLTGGTIVQCRVPNNKKTN
jgi:hypothetical protein